MRVLETARATGIAPIAVTMTSAAAAVQNTVIAILAIIFLSSRRWVRGTVSIYAMKKQAEI